MLVLCLSAVCLLLSIALVVSVGVSKRMLAMVTDMLAENAAKDDSLTDAFNGMAESLLPGLSHDMMNMTFEDSMSAIGEAFENALAERCGSVAEFLDMFNERVHESIDARDEDDDADDGEM